MQPQITEETNLMYEYMCKYNMCMNMEKRVKN